MERRLFLTTAGTALTALTVGCTALATDSDTDEYTFGVFNEAQEFHSFRVRIASAPSEYFHEETVELDGKMADEEVTFEGTPVRIHVEIGDSKEAEFPWPASSSNKGEIASIANIYYDPTREQEVLVYGDS